MNQSELIDLPTGWPTTNDHNILGVILDIQNSKWSDRRITGRATHQRAFEHFCDALLETGHAHVAEYLKTHEGKFLQKYLSINKIKTFNTFLVFLFDFYPKGKSHYNFKQIFFVQPMVSFNVYSSMSVELTSIRRFQGYLFCRIIYFKYFKSWTATDTFRQEVEPHCSDYFLDMLVSVFRRSTPALQNFAERKFELLLREQESDIKQREAEFKEMQKENLNLHLEISHLRSFLR